VLTKFGVGYTLSLNDLYEKVWDVSWHNYDDDVYVHHMANVDNPDCGHCGPTNLISLTQLLTK